MDTVSVPRHHVAVATGVDRIPLRGGRGMNMRIAHFSDLHLLSLDGVPMRRFLNKRLTGWANLRFKRGHIHRASHVRAIARAIADAGVDHVVVTGDFTNLALESEFELARDVLVQDLGVDPDRVTVVPGNHDVYTRGAMTSRRFEMYFSDWLESDLPELAVDTAASARFPVVKLRGHAAIVSLSSAVPRLPLVAAGELGRAQLDALARVLAHPEVARRTLVLALHHPAVQDGWSTLKTHLDGLRDAPELLSLLMPLSRGLVLHGHLHRRIQRILTTTEGTVHHVGATSASLHDERDDRMAGFNVYELDEQGVKRIESRVCDPATGAFAPASVPKYV
jgi:3',5'-cyclic AMP phosphodiesterase CpdA